MLMLAALLGMAAVGGFLLFDEADATPSDTDADTQDRDAPDNSPAGQPTIPMEEFLITGSDGSDHLSGTELPDRLQGLGGNDQLNGYGGNDDLTGDDGDDRLFGGTGDDTLSGGNNSDLLHGEDGNDLINGGNGVDTLYGHFGNDHLSGGEGDDVAHGGVGQDTLTGGSGADALHGNDGGDNISGGADQDSLFGGGGDDLLNGSDDRAQKDYLNGGEGNDTIIAGANDVVTGGQGADHIVFAQTTIEPQVTDPDHPDETTTQLELIDFEPGEDQLALHWDHDGNTTPRVEVKLQEGSTNSHVISIDGQEAVVVIGPDTLQASDIILLDQDQAANLGLAGDAPANPS